MPSQKHMLLFGLLALTLSATVWVSDRSEHGQADVVEPVTGPAAKPRSAPQAKPKGDGKSLLPLYKLERVSMIVRDKDPFSARSWYTPPPPPPSPPPVPAPVPSAPALPFAYAGKLQGDTGRWIFYLTRGEQSFAVSLGDTFDNVYRLEGVENGKLTIQYLPLSIKQFLSIATES